MNAMKNSGFLLAICFSLFAQTPSAHAEDGKTSAAPSATSQPAIKKMTDEQIAKALRAANKVAIEWKKFGHHPFGAVILGPDNETVLMSQGNLSVVRHAETDLTRRASETYSPEYLASCTLVTTMEPCAMCAGTIYWANIGRVVYGSTEKTLKKLTGDSQMNPTMNFPCKQVFESGQKSIEVIGPVPELEAELIEPHKGFWK